MASKIDPACEIAGEMKRMLVEQLKAVLAKSRDRRTPLSERVHASRVAIKKCRAALKLLRFSDEGRYRRENRALAGAVRPLGHLRDAGVRVEAFDALLRQFGASRKKYARVRTLLTTSRREAMPAATGVEHELRIFGRRLRPVQRRVEAWELEVSPRQVAAAFRHTYRQARTAYREAVSKPRASNFHQWRKAAKAHYYQCRLLRAAAPKSMKGVCLELRELGKMLGSEHDLTLLKLFLKQRLLDEPSVVDEKITSAVLKLIRERRRDLCDAVRPLGSRLFAERPRLFEKRVKQWWAVR